MRTKRDNTQEVANARHCLACMEACGALLRLYDKHSGNSFVALNDYIVSEWPGDTEDWQRSCEILGLDDPYRVERDVVEALALDLGVSITYLATRERSIEEGWSYSGFELLVSTSGHTSRVCVRCDKEGQVTSSGLEWQNWWEPWTLLKDTIEEDALRCIAMIGYVAAEQWTWAYASTRNGLFRVTYRPQSVDMEEARRVWKRVRR